MSKFFFNCDWGTTRFRLRLIEAAGQTVLAECRTEDGAARLSSIETTCREQLFRNVLQQHVAALDSEVEFDLQGVPVLISGMASSTLGWRDLPYARLPFALNGSDLIFDRLDTEEAAAGRPIFLFSGVRSDRDVMRGEELELMGVADSAIEQFSDSGETWVILPGTHSKHARIVADVMVEFHTYMTGELFQLFGRQSSLRHREGDMTSIVLASLNGEMPQWEAAFNAGVEESQNDGLSANLFQVRTRQVLHGENPIQSSAFLSGILIGSELQSLAARCSIDSSMILAASHELSVPYRLAFEKLKINRVTVMDPGNVTRLSAWGQHRALQQILGDAEQGRTAPDSIPAES